MKSDRESHLTHCLNCSTSLETSDQYCGNCGQKANNGKLPLVQMAREFLSDELNLDGKFLITLRSILVPGKLTSDYFSGKRKKQINPIRLFFIVVILGLAVLQIYEMPFEDLVQVSESLGYGDRRQTENTIDSLEIILAKRKVPDSDSIIQDLKINLHLEEDSLDLKHENFELLGAKFEYTLKGSSKVSRKDFENLSPSQLVKNKGLKVSRRFISGKKLNY